MDLRFLQLNRATVGAIPTGLHHSAQGWPRQRTTLGNRSKIIFNPNGVASAARANGFNPFRDLCKSPVAALYERRRVAISSKTSAVTDRRYNEK